MAKDQEVMEKHEGTLRVIVFQDDGLWVAQCLEHDIGAQADDFDTLMTRLEVTVKAELKESIEKNGKPFAGIDPAPERFQHMWERRARSIEMTIPPWMHGAEKVSLGLVA
jgi:hypothetical protein